MDPVKQTANHSSLDSLPLDARQARRQQSRLESGILTQCP